MHTEKLALCYSFFNELADWSPHNRFAVYFRGLSCCTRESVCSGSAFLLPCVSYPMAASSLSNGS